MALLQPEQIATKLSELPLEWAVISGIELQKPFKFSDFETALKFVNQVGEKAEKLNHHPNILLTYGRVDITIATHSEGGLTQKDFELAKEIERI